jgi:hypothetical protein
MHHTHTPSGSERSLERGRTRYDGRAARILGDLNGIIDAENQAPINHADNYVRDYA